MCKYAEMLEEFQRLEKVLPPEKFEEYSKNILQKQANVLTKGIKNTGKFLWKHKGTALGTGLLVGFSAPDIIKNMKKALNRPIDPTSKVQPPEMFENKQEKINRQTIKTP